MKINFRIFSYITIKYIFQYIHCIAVSKIDEKSYISFPLSDNNLEASIFVKDTEYKLQIDISADRTWINSNNIDNKNKNNLLINECKINNIEEKKIIKNTDISFFDEDLTLEKIIIEKLTKDNKLNCDNINGVIGLSKKSESKKLNLLTMLNDNYSLKKFFSVYNSNLVIGNFDNQLNNQNILSSDLLDIGYQWTFNLQGIFIGDLKDKKNNIITIETKNENFKYLNLPMSFHTLQKLIIVNKNIINFFKDKLLSKCTFMQNSNENFEGFYCNKNIISSLPIINFIINDQILSISPSKLFVDLNENESLFIIVYSNIINENEGTIGSLIFNNNDVQIIFDAENNKIHFVSKSFVNKIKIIDEFSVNDNSKFSRYDYVLIFVLIINIFGVILLFTSLYKEKSIKEFPKEIKKFKGGNI